MRAPVYRWKDVVEDNPIPLLTRRMVTGEKALVAKVFLAKGCQVACHQHVSEQIAVMVSGRVRWIIGAEGDPDRYDFEAVGGDVIQLPSGIWHAVDTLEDSEI